MRRIRMARFSLLGLAVSLGLHGLAYASLGLAPERVPAPRLPPSVLMEAVGPAPLAAPKPEAEPPPEPPVAERAREPRRGPAPVTETEVVPERSPSGPVDLSGVTLTNADGSGSFAMPAGDGRSRTGPLGPLGAEPAPAPAPPSAPPVPSPAATPELVASADLSRRPVPPALDVALRNFYPDEARRRGLSGTASLRVRIEADGRVRRASVLIESADGFGAACRRAVVGSTWSAPLDRSGRAVATEVRYTCRFLVQ